jgi:hypothetical protein
MLVGIANDGLIDWNNLQIIETIDKEGRLQVISEEQMFDILWFKVQEERAQKEIVVNWDIGKAATNVLSMEQRKVKKPLYYLYIVCFYFNQLKCLSVLQMLAERENQGRTPLRVGFQLKFQHWIGTPTQMKMCSQQGKKKVINF